MDSTNQLLVLFHVAIAMILGGAIGYEREKEDKPAGLRTAMLISGTSCLLILLGNSLIAHYASHHAASLLRSDPLRIIQAIIIGIGFVASGTIVKQKDEMEVANLTTAASVIMSAGIGISVAIDEYILAAGLTIFTLLITQALLPLKKQAKKQ